MFGAVGTPSLQTDTMQMFESFGVQPYMPGCISAGKDVGNVNSRWQSGHHMQCEREAALGGCRGVMDNFFDNPAADRIWTPGPLPSKEQSFISSEAQDGWQPELSDILPSYLVEQLLTSAGSLESKCGSHLADSPRRGCQQARQGEAIWNMHDKARPPGHFSVPMQDAKPPAPQQSHEHCAQCGTFLYEDSNFCSKCGAKVQKDVFASPGMEPGCYEFYNPGLWGMPPKEFSPSLSRDSSGEIPCQFVRQDERQPRPYVPEGAPTTRRRQNERQPDAYAFEYVPDGAPTTRGRQDERQPHAYSCVSRTPSPPAVSHFHPLVRENLIKPTETPLEQLKEQFVEQPVKHTFIHFDTPNLESSCDKDSECSDGSTTNSDRTLNKSATAPSLIMQNLVFQIKSNEDGNKIQSDGIAMMKLVHLLKKCTPCAYFHNKEDGCRLGDDCQFCHFCPAPPAKRTKKERSAMRFRMLQQRWAANPNGKSQRNARRM